MPSLDRPVEHDTTTRYRLSFPPVNELADQDSECCDVELPEGRRRIRFHDYADIYAVPGLYEQLFYDELRCQSPRMVSELMAARLETDGVDPRTLRVLDLGAGNGMVGECLAELGIGTLVGLDLLPEAATATARDRPGTYDLYVVDDLTAPTAETCATLEAARFTCLTSVAALGFGDVPPEAFAAAASFVQDGGWIVFCIKERFLADGDGSGFARFIRRAVDAGTLEILEQRVYQHRLAATGEPLHYAAVVARKHGTLSV